MSNLWGVNPEMPRPFPRQLESIRVAAMERWGNASISQADILMWIYEGCPDAQNALLSAATRQPPIPGQGEIAPEAYADTLFKCEVFLPRE